jgi:hypothetical protein
VTIIANFPFDDGFRARQGIEPRFWRDRVQNIEPVLLKTFLPHKFQRGVLDQPCTLAEISSELFSSRMRCLTPILNDCSTTAGGKASDIQAVFHFSDRACIRHAAAGP